MKKHIFNIYYILLPIILIANIVVKSLFIETVTLDTKTYIQIAKDLPIICNSVFPILYPVILKIANFLINDYFIASKIVCILSLVLILIFTKIKNFYWREFWVLLTLPSLLQLYPYSLSESIILPLLILFLYVNYNYIKKDIKPRKYIVINSLLLFLMFLIKYSSLYILAGFFVFTAILFFINKNKFKTLLLSGIVSGVICGVYLFFNYSLTGFFTGERIDVTMQDLSFNPRMSTYNLFYVLDPILEGRTFLEYGVNYNLKLILNLLWMGGIFLYIGKKLKNNKDVNYRLIIIFCLIISVTFIILTYISYFYIKIDILNSRLLLNYYFLLYSAIIFLGISKKSLTNIIIPISIISLLINFININI